MEMLIPFAGFYESTHDGMIDDAHNSLSMDDNGNLDDALWNFLYNAVNWQTVRMKYAKEYAEQLAENFGIKYEFNTVDSPREYNFTTDRLVVNIELPEVIRMYTETNTEKLAAIAKEKFTSRSGFISFYPPNIANWGAIQGWDHNQLGTLFEAYIATQEPNFKEDSVMEDSNCNGELDEWILSAMSPEDLATYNAMYEKLRGE